jgi:hypothetical protein
MAMQDDKDFYNLPYLADIMMSLNYPDDGTKNALQSEGVVSQCNIS